MEKIGLFWGSNTGNQEDAVKFLQEYMEGEGYTLELFNIADTDPIKMLDYNKLIIGCPTWHIGELQDDWETIYDEYKKIDFNGKTAAFFGMGDQIGYPDNFLDAIGLLAKPFMENGGKLIGRWPTEGYEFDNSVAQDGDDFVSVAWNPPDPFCEGIVNNGDNNNQLRLNGYNLYSKHYHYRG